MRKKIIIIVVIFVFFLSLIATYQFYPPTFNLKKGNIKLEYGQKYREPGFKVTRFGHDYTSKVKKQNHIDYKKIGTYDIDYQIKIGFMTFTKTRKVKIVDDEKPIITLNGDLTKTICPNAEYQEEGYKATDNYDGDLTKKVKVKNENGLIYYSVVDSSKNKTEITRQIIKEDKTPPQITLNGKNETIYKGTSYQDKGASVTDNCDNNLNIKTSGTVDTNKIGTYTITYEVTDLSGNVSSVKRTVKVIEKPAQSSKPGVIYLTFDDGPNEGTTNVILDILKEENVKATFFVTGKGPDYLIQREYNEGHTVGLHTYSHNYQSVYSSANNYYQDLYQIQNRVKNLTGYESKIIRFPGGSSNTVNKKYSSGIMTYLTKDVVNKGFKYYDWNISSGDAGETTSSSGVYNNVIKSLSKNRSNIILMHDIKPYTRDALRDIINYGKNNGYTFEKITINTPMVTHKVNN